MPVIFNKKCERGKRKRLRKSIPKAEFLLWQYLKNKQLLGFKFRRQYSIGRYIVDFYCPKARLAIEVDGPTHFTEKAKAYDQSRQKYIESFGIAFLRVTNLDIYQNREGVIEQISNIINSRRKRGKKT